MDYTIKETDELFYIGETPDSKIASLDYEIDEGVFILDGVKVDSSLRGQGIAAKLVKHAVEFARKNNLLIDPACSYAKAQFDKHEEYADIRYRKG